MKQFVLSLFQVCLFRRKPQDLPASGTLLTYAASAAFIVFFLRNTLLSGSGNSFPIALVQVVLLGISLKALLILFSKRERWLQSATALFGCSALLVAAVIPFLISAGSGDFANEGLSAAKLIVMFASVWYFAIIIFIIRETLEVSLILGFVIALVLELLLASVILKMFGDSLL